MDPFVLQRKNEIQRRIINLTNRMNQANSEAAKLRNEIATINSGIYAHENEIDDKWTQIRALNADVNEHLAVDSVIKQREARFFEATDTMRSKVLVVGAHSTTVRFARGYSQKLGGMLNSTQHTQAVENIKSAKLSMARRLNNLESQISEREQRIRFLEQRIEEDKSKVRSLNNRVRDLDYDCNWCRGEINRLTRELRNLV